MTKNFAIALGVLALAACLLLAPILALARTLEPSAEAACAAQGGCAWVSRQWVLDRLAETRQEAYRQATVSCGRVL